jgi:hypothetical protein
VGGRRRPGRRTRTTDRGRPGHQLELATGLPRQPARGHHRLRPGSSWFGRESRPGAPTDTWGRCCWGRA